ncbi:MAG: hypothetical protein C0404_12575 [Verrucomicrobia bacterium]|nr:hypothetical protein [Verrucomicrobiota bacterium]
MNDRRRVVVTGMGLVTSLGLTPQEVWDNMLAARCGISRLSTSDHADFKTHNGGVLAGQALAEALKAAKITPADRAVDMALLVSKQALEHSRLATGDSPGLPQELPVIFGTGIGSSESYFSSMKALFEKGVRGIRPTTVPRCMTNAVSAQVSMKFRLTGPNYVIVSACTSSTNAIGSCFRLIKDGYYDRALCGGTDSPFDLFAFGAWNNLGVMSRNPDPAKACRPFDAARDGTILGEGAGAMVLESLESARTRGAGVLAEICGFGESSDAEHITTPSADGQARAMRMALSSAGMQPTDVGFINAHGTATKANDECEARSIRTVFGEQTGRIPVASSKSFFGHLLGASGIAETIVTVMGLRAGRVPPNLGLENKDPACDLLLVGSQPMELQSPVATKNSFGFGGNNAVLVLRRWQE